jgi:anaerobic magnesium-protoporphyrin IX monomethyl ester cyclase
MAKILFTLFGASSPGTQPLNVSILSSICNQAGHETALFDTTFMDLGFDLDTEVSQRDTVFEKIDYTKLNLIREDVDAKQLFIQKIKDFKPDIIASSAMSDMFYWTHTILTYTKEQGFDIPVICGGVHSTLQPDDVMSYDCIDYNVIGEGEGVLLPLIDSILNKEEPGPLTSVPVMYRKAGNIKKTTSEQKLVNLDDLPFLNWEFYDERQFYRPFMGKLVRSGDVQTMRGCPKRCSYCANAELNKVYATMDGWSGWRTYEPERFVEEAKYLSKRHNLEFFKFYDEDMLLMPEENLAKLSELYRKEVNVPFTMQCHPNSVTLKKAELLKNMNCASVTLSMECGNYHYRRNILNRHYSNEKFINTVDILNKVGIRSAALTMIGLPFESRKMIFETIELGRQAKATHTNTNIFFPYFGTPLGDMARDNKFCVEDEVRKAKFDASRTLLNMPQIDPKEVEKIRKLWSFYIKWPKFMFPFFTWLEKDSFLRKNILKIFEKMDDVLKSILNNRDKNSRRAIDLVAEAKRIAKGRTSSLNALDIEKSQSKAKERVSAKYKEEKDKVLEKVQAPEFKIESIFGTVKARHVDQFHNQG